MIHFSPLDFGDLDFDDLDFGDLDLDHPGAIVPEAPDCGIGSSGNSSWKSDDPNYEGHKITRSKAQTLRRLKPEFLGLEQHG